MGVEAQDALGGLLIVLMIVVMIVPRMVMGLPGAALADRVGCVTPGASLKSTNCLPLTASEPLDLGELGLEPLSDDEDQVRLAQCRQLLRGEGGAVLRHVSRQQQFGLAHIPHHGGDDAMNGHHRGDDLGGGNGGLAARQAARAVRTRRIGKSSCNVII